VLEIGYDVDLAEEPVRPGRRGEALTEDLEGHASAMAHIPGEVDRRHATLADLALEFVMTRQGRPEPARLQGIE
jgi:hypothetical protein